jgi:hypothetical protein
MQLVAVKAVIAMLWVSAVSAAAIAPDVSSLASWTVLAGVALLPPIVMMRWSNDPHQSKSPIIQEALL